ncbi:carbohydrate binding domain-containing protein [Paenibacillus sp. HWE-109]|uniref:carbohydrate binding domain-containing protein n=1 Tax=Paenibacillus sp. HWE-109 TaxID=1306526 RepID=UPI001EE1172C|nr:carbohydrate binding domain-containing protein [Paenibacillus sp. HWE-109]UKS26877.1 carbohydrate binding domain-containing protein [Paenibacillus sp. HWE-109]
MNGISKRILVSFLILILFLSSCPPLKVWGAEVPTTNNLIQNPGFEEVAGGKPVGWSEVLRVAGPIAASVTGNTYKDGERALQITAQAASPKPRLAAYQIVGGIVPGKTYDFSAWIKTENVVAGGAVPIRLSFLDDTSPWWSPVGGQYTLINAGLTGTNGWTQLQAQVTAPAGAARLVVELLPNEAEGSFWFDKLSFAKQPIPKDPNNMIQNPGFEEVAGGKPVGWSEALRVAGPIAASVTGNTYKDGEQALQITAQAASPKPRLAVYQVVEGIVPGKTYDFSTWIKTENAVAGGAVPIRLSFLDDTSPWWSPVGGQYTLINAALTGTNAWTQLQAQVVAPAGAARLVVELLPVEAEGSFWFDKLSFAKQPFPKDPNNLIQNPGFEEIAGGKPVGWSEALRVAGPIVAGVTGNTYKDGEQALQITAQAASPRPRMAVYQIVGGIIPGKTYDFSAWIKTENAVAGGEVPIRLSFLDDTSPWWSPVGGQYTQINAGLSGTNNWAQLQAQLTAPAGASRLVVELLPNGVEGSFWFDKLSFAKQLLPKDPNNLIQNSGFEEVAGSKPVGWSEALRVAGPIAASVTGNTYKDGEQALQITTQTASPKPRLAIYQVVEGIVPGKPYDFSAWIKTENAVAGGAVPIRLSFLDDTSPWWSPFGGQYTLINAGLTGTNDWAQLQAQVVAPAGASRLVVELLPNEAEGNFWFDKISLKKWSELQKGLEQYRNVHSRIMIDDNRIAQLRADIASGGTYAHLWEEFKQHVDQTILGAPPAYYIDTIEEDVWQRIVGDQTVDFAFAYLMTLDARYLTAAEKWTMASIGYPSWGRGIFTNSDLAAGHQLFSLAVVYDWLYDELDAPTKSTILKTLKERGTEMYSRATGQPYNGKKFTMWWTETYLQNHMWVDLTGLTAAALAIYDVEPSVVPWLDFSIDKLAKVEQALGDDGASQEGFPYWEYGADALIKYAKMTKPFIGSHMLQNEWFQNNSTYAAYMMLGRDYWTRQSSYINYADTAGVNWYGPDYLLRVLAAENGDGLAQWLASLVDDKNIDNPIDRWMGILYYDPSIPETPVTSLPTMHHFDDMDMVVSRSGWSGDESVLYFKSGPPIGHKERETNTVAPIYDWGASHVHPDANHMVLHANGEYLLRDDGFSDKLTANHNTLLINGKGQLGEGGRWFDFNKDRSSQVTPHIIKTETGSSFDYMAGDATGAYDMTETSLQKFERHLIYLKPNTLIVIDDIHLAAPQDLELRFFPESQQILGNGNDSYLAFSQKNTLRFQSLTPDGTEVQAEPVYYKSDSFKGNRTAFTIKNESATVWRNAVAISWEKGEAVPADIALTKTGDVWTFDTGTQAVAFDFATQHVTETESTSTGTTSDPATLEAIKINGKLLDNYRRDQYTYNYSYENKKPDPQITYLKRNPTDVVNMTYTGTIPGTVQLQVISADAATTHTYTINIEKTDVLPIYNSTSSTYIEQSGPWNVYDEDMQTFWSAKISAEHITSENPNGYPWMTLDLGASQSVSELAVAWYNGTKRQAYFDVDVSLDGVSWVAAGSFTSSGTTDDYETYPITPTSARYVRFWGKGTSTGIINSIKEITVYE